MKLAANHFKLAAALALFSGSSFADQVPTVIQQFVAPCALNSVTAHPAYAACENYEGAVSRVNIGNLPIHASTLKIRFLIRVPDSPTYRVVEKIVKRPFVPQASLEFDTFLFSGEKLEHVAISGHEQTSNISIAVQ